MPKPRYALLTLVSLALLAGCGQAGQASETPTHPAEVSSSARASAPAPSSPPRSSASAAAASGVGAPAGDLHTLIVVDSATSQQFAVDAAATVEERLPAPGQPLDIRMLLRATHHELRFTLADLTARTPGGDVVTAQQVPGNGKPLSEGIVPDGQILEGNVALYIPRGKFVLTLSLPGVPPITWKRTN